jgi:plastocyanin domain-containing protein
MKKNLAISLLFVAIIALGWMIIANKQTKTDPQLASTALSSNVSTENSKQVIEITAKGGYEPRISTAKANIPTVLRVKTSSTFDCSSALRIPSIGYSKNSRRI